MSVDQMTRGAAIACNVAHEVNSARQLNHKTQAAQADAQAHAVDAADLADAQAQTQTMVQDSATTNRMIDVIDIGGGLPVTWGDNPQAPTFAEYGDALRKNVPTLFSGTFSRMYVKINYVIN